jgi:hypothetical protein
VEDGIDRKQLSLELSFNEVAAGSGSGIQDDQQAS